MRAAFKGIHAPLQPRHPPMVGGAASHDRSGKPIEAHVHLGSVPVDPVVLRGDHPDQSGEDIHGLIETRVRALLRLLDRDQTPIESTQALVAEA